MEKTKEPGVLALLAVLSLGIVSGCSGMLTPAVASIAAEFPDMPYESITLIMTIVNIVDLPIVLVVGMIVGKKIGFRPLCLFGTLVFSLGGIIPFFAAGSYPIVMASRVLVAIGCGCVMALPATLAFRIFKGEKSQLVQGWGNATASVASALMMMVVGQLAALSIDLIWLSHLIGILTFVLVLVGLPEPAKEDTSANAEATKSEKTRTPFAAWGCALFGLVAMILMYPVLINSSLIIVGNGWGDAGIAGICNAVSTVGCFLAGMVFGKLYAKLPRITMLSSGVIAGLGSLLVFFASGFIMMAIGVFMVGWGYMQIFCCAMGAAGIITPPAKMAFVMSLMLIASNLAVFIAPFVAVAIQTAMGATGYQEPFVVIAVLWAIAGVVLFMWNPQGRAIQKGE